MSASDEYGSGSGALFGRISGQSDLTAQENANGLRMIAALSMTKISDGLLDPKLVLSWMLHAVGAPGVLIGALVPLREAGALLPQAVLAGLLARMRRGKWMWVAGSAVQGLAALVIALSGATLSGWVAGIAVCAALTVLAVARSACSVSFKAVQGKTVKKGARGAVTGSAASLSSVAVIVFALMLLSGLLNSVGVVALAVALSGVLWIAAALTFAGLKEDKGSRRGSDSMEFARLWREDWLLRRFVLVRGLLVSTALAPPYLVILSQGSSKEVLSGLGALVLASALASFCASYVWGRLSDRSSRVVLCLSGLLGAVAMAAMVALSLAGLAGVVWVAPPVLFVLMIAYQGVRQARSTYLVDMSPEGFRGSYAAIANTAIGVLLLIAGAAGSALAAVSATVALGFFAVLSLLGGLLAMTLHTEARARAGH